MSHFPVTASTLSAAHLNEFIQKTYGRSAATTCRLFRTGMNHLYMITDGSSKFVFRVYTDRWRTKVAISEELRLLEHLKEQGVPVAYPIADSQGIFLQEFNAPEGLRYGVLFSFAKGEKVPYFTAETSYHIGRTMGKMHLATKNFVLERVHYNADSLLLNSLKRTKGVFKTPSAPMTFIEALNAYLLPLYNDQQDLDLPTGAIHLDLWFDNMHFGPENEVTFFDFDFCGNGWLCHDVSYFLYQLFSTHPKIEDYEAKAAQFLKGYTEINALSEEEHALIPKICLALMLFYIGIQCYRFDWSNVFLSEHHLKRMTDMMKRWMDHHQIELPS